MLNWVGRSLELVTLLLAHVSALSGEEEVGPNRQFLGALALLKFGCGWKSFLGPEDSRHEFTD